VSRSPNRTVNDASKPDGASIVGKLLIAFLGAVCAAVGTFVWDQYIKPKPVYVTIQVFDDSQPQQKPLKNVAVWLGLSDVESKPTGDFGLVRFEIPRKHRHDVVTPRYILDGYSPIRGQTTDRIALDSGDTINTVVLQRTVAIAVAPQFEQRVYSSGARASGPGAAFSNWYDLCNDPPPEGWMIEQASFVLTGDRQCNAWSECRQTVNEPRRVCWQFRMQGHSEQTSFLNPGNTGIQFSTGILTIRWRH
jgi:hypothetical protein